MDRTVLVRYEHLADPLDRAGLAGVCADVMCATAGEASAPVLSPPGSPPMGAAAAGADGWRYRVLFDRRGDSGSAAVPDFQVEVACVDATVRTGHVATQVGMHLGAYRSWPLGRVRLMMHGVDAGWGHGSCWDPVAGRWRRFAVVPANADVVDRYRLLVCPFCVVDNLDGVSADD